MKMKKNPVKNHYFKDFSVVREKIKIDSKMYLRLCLERCSLRFPDTTFPLTILTTHDD